MLGTLSTPQCVQLLQSEVIGRLACTTNGKVYIIPITYAFDGKYLYAHSKEGLKLQMMRKNSSVCFEVDRIENMVNWRSVIVHGKFEELKTRSTIAYAIQLLSERLDPLLHSQAIKPVPIKNEASTVVKGLRAIYYRIRITEISGRFEKPDLTRH